ncbi:MAG: DegT/DnrJ/EryC1/StrS family aminotransferase [Geminicoccaceae bacterium]|nr:DegT/DnrJ/EryC1/StrS family aminotransferase [Geminicoccaceae bacterium]
MASKIGNEAVPRGAAEEVERARISVPWQRPSLKATLVSKPSLHRHATAYVEDVLESGWWGYGPVAQALEARIAELYDGRSHVLATSSCTAAMHLALRTAGVGPDDEVIVPAFTYVSTAVVASYCGATPIFADIEPDTMTISAATVERALSTRTRAIIPMHYAGPARDFGPIRELAADRRITVVEDAAHAFGSRHAGRMVAADADFAAFSFAPTKPLASSNGGLLLYRDGELRERINQLAFLGLAKDTFNRTIASGVSPPQLVARIGHKYKIDDVAAAVTYAGVEELAAIVADRAKLADRYYERLGDIGAVTLLPRSNDETVWYIFPIRVPADRRDVLRAALAEARIDTTVHYPNLLEQPAFRGCGGDAPVTAEQSRRVLSLPMHRAMDENEVDRIAEIVRRVVA